MPDRQPHPMLGLLLWAVVCLALMAPVRAQTTVVVQQPSAAGCAAQAERAAMNTTGVMGGAVRGGVGGAAVGAIVGGSKGARTGVAAGAVVGGVAGAARRDDVYKRVYDDCMRGY